MSWGERRDARADDRDEALARAAEDRRRMVAQAQAMAEWSRKLAERADALAHGQRRAETAERAQRAAEELARRDRAQAARFVAVLEQMPVGVVLAEIPAGGILLANAVALRLLGHAPPDLAGLRAALHPDGTPYAPEEHPLARAVRREETVAGEELRYRLGDDLLADVWVTAAPIRDEGGHAVLAVATFEDISARRALERTREEFLAAAAHDLKTPLTSMAGYAQLARRRLERLSDPEAGTVVPLLVGIEEGIHHQVGLINDLLDVAHQEMGAPLRLAIRPTDLVALARTVAERQGGATGRIDVEVDVPALPAAVDAARLERVLGNLLSNAIKYSPAGGPITVRVGREETPGGPVAVIAVTDRGLGIPAADLPHIFERFRRAANVIGHIQGTGIGLASARSIVEQHGGTIGAESVEGSGSTFTIRLPLGETGGA